MLQGLLCCYAFSLSLNGMYVVYCKKSFYEIDCFGSRVVLCMRINVFLEIGRWRNLDISILKCFDDVVANVFLLATFSFG